jgi:hypothetical protein
MSKGLYKITGTADLFTQACADEVKIKHVSVLEILYNLLCVAFFTDITF